MAKNNILKLTNVSKIYQLGDNKIIALNKINLSINKREFLAIIGPSGSGKSTLLQVASILAHPTSGNIFLNQKNITKFNEIERAHLRNKEIGFIFQQFNLLKKTSALENVALPLLYSGVNKPDRLKKAEEMLTKLGLQDRLKNTPAQLSGGQQQRVAIARALVNDPSIIFADEPTGNLDSKSGNDVEDILKELNDEGKTIVMVTHELDITRIAKRMIVIKDGEIVSDKLIKSSKKKKK